MRRLRLLRRIGTVLILLTGPGLAAASLALVTIESNKALANYSFVAPEPGPNLTNSSPVTPNISLDPVAGGFTQPTDIANAGDERLFVTEKAGLIHIIQGDGTVLPTPFLDISAQVDSSGLDPGLLGLVFHPDYASNGYFYLNYINNDFETTISRFTVSADANVADAGSELVLLTIPQPHSNHNGGDLNFGPDGYLYIGLGDGGSQNDPDDRGQDLGDLLAKMLRIDVDGVAGVLPDCGSDANYTIPADNPFVDGAGNNCDEIWALGLRNPWRFSFDRLTGDMYIADVGQNTWEEIDFQAISSSGGENYGWRCYEGNHPFNTTGCGPINQYTFPIAEYSISSSPDCSVTGGYVYRGSRYPGLVGHYLFADYCSGRFRSLFPDGLGGWQLFFLGDFSGNYTTFGEGVDGELYVARYDNGTVYHIQDLNPYLTITKSGPATAMAGMPITYTLTVTNSGQAGATNLLITDTIPSDANYVSGGTRLGNVVSWTVAGLSAAGGVTQTTFVVTATQTITNSQYGVRADGGHRAVGMASVTTLIGDPDADLQDIFLPLILKQ